LVFDADHRPIQLLLAQFRLDRCRIKRDLNSLAMK